MRAARLDTFRLEVAAWRGEIRLGEEFKGFKEFELLRNWLRPNSSRCGSGTVTAPEEDYGHAQARPLYIPCCQGWPPSAACSLPRCCTAR